ncbi:MAG: SCO6745 family protein [Acidimicrobiales bacterium]
MNGAPRAHDGRATGDELVHELGSAYFFVPATLARGRELGLDGLRFYVLGRGGVLGDVEAPVVAAAFGYFEPSLLARMWDTGRSRVAPRDAARAHLACGHAFGRERFAGVEGLDRFCAAAEAVVAAADPAGLALFAGVAAEPLPGDLPARAMQLVAVLRELRGSTHLLAVVASGLPPRVAHSLERPDAFELFGWSAGQVPAVTDADRVAHAAAKALTDRLLAVPYGVLDDAGRADLRTGAERLTAAAG